MSTFQVLMGDNRFDPMEEATRGMALWHFLDMLGAAHLKQNGLCSQLIGIQIVIVRMFFSVGAHNVGIKLILMASYVVRAVRNYRSAEVGACMHED
jgi:hypothetical protein